MLWWAPFLLFQLQPLDIPDKNPHTAPADIEQGKRLYMGRCAGCHGPSGDGGKGANLAVPNLPRASADRSLYRIIRFGIPDTEMPGSLMDTHELWQTAAFVKTLGKVTATPVIGSAKNGEQVFRTKGNCLNCHALGLHGGRIGPSLSGIGALSVLGMAHQAGINITVDEWKVGQVYGDVVGYTSGGGVNATPTNIVTSVSGDQLTLSWPSDHIGWRLQLQTNALDTGIDGNWFDVAGSTVTNQMTFTIDPANPTVFFRMILP